MSPIPQQRFCEQCGAALGANARFCGGCGQAVVAAPEPAPAAQAEKPLPAQAQACAAAEAAPKKGGGILSRLLFILIGLALIFLGLRGPILGVLGQRAAAVVTYVVASSGDHQYEVHYYFTASGGTEVRGSWTQEALNVTALPDEGDTVAVRYLPAWPAISVPASQTAPGVANLVLSALGLALILFSGRVRIS